VGYADRQTIGEDYQELLDRGYVVRRYTNAFGWMSALSFAARSDCLHIDTELSSLDEQLVWALLRRSASSDRMGETARLLLLGELALAVTDGELEALD
jgi:hypothetical protein